MQFKRYRRSKKNKIKVIRQLSEKSLIESHMNLMGKPLERNEVVEQSQRIIYTGFLID
jgi:hypothetical protein